MNYRIRFHPLVARDLDAIAHWIRDYAMPEGAARKLAEIEAAIATLEVTPHKGSLRDEIAPGLRAIPSLHLWPMMTKAKCWFALSPMAVRSG